MFLEFPLKKHPELRGLLISGGIYAVLARLYIFSSIIPFLLFTITLLLGLIIGRLMRMTEKRYPWLKAGFLVSLVYIPLFLLVISDDPAASWGIPLFIILLPTSIFLLISPMLDARFPSIMYFVQVVPFGIINLGLFFLVISKAVQEFTQRK